MKFYSEISEDEIINIYKRVAKNIKDIRKSKKISQEEVALTMGFTTATFYTNAESLKRGKHFNLEHIIKISKILNCDISVLFKDIDNPIKEEE